MVGVLKLRSMIMLMILEKYVSYAESYSYLKGVDIQKVTIVLVILIKRGDANIVCGKAARECDIDRLVQESPLRWQWRYVFLALTHRYMVFNHIWMADTPICLMYLDDLVNVYKLILL